MGLLGSDLIAARAIYEKRPRLGAGGAIHLAVENRRRERDAIRAMIDARGEAYPDATAEWLALFDEAILRSSP